MARAQLNHIDLAAAPAVRDVSGYYSAADRWGVSGRVAFERSLMARSSAVLSVSVTRFRDRLGLVPPASASRRLDNSSAASFSTSGSDWDANLRGHSALTAVTGSVGWRGYLFSPDRSPFIGLGGGLSVLTAEGQESWRLQPVASVGYSHALSARSRATVEAAAHWLGLELSSFQTSSRPTWIVPIYFGLSFGY